jgi:hypothetical protein
MKKILVAAHFEHTRRVVLTAEAHAPHAPFLMFSEVMAMNAHEWRKAAEEGFGVHVLPTGGWTTCTLLDTEGKPVAVGTVACSQEDNYVKALGRIKSLGYAKSALKAAS